MQFYTIFTESGLMEKIVLNIIVLHDRNKNNKNMVAEQFYYTLWTSIADVFCLRDSWDVIFCLILPFLFL